MLALGGLWADSSEAAEHTKLDWLELLGLAENRCLRSSMLLNALPFLPRCSSRPRVVAGLIEPLLNPWLVSAGLLVFRLQGSQFADEPFEILLGFREGRFGVRRGRPGGRAILSLRSGNRSNPNQTPEKDADSCGKRARPGKPSEPISHQSPSIPASRVGS